MIKNSFIQNPIKTTRGYTLIELMVVLAVMGILVIAATGGFYSLVGSKRAQTELIKLKSVLELAKIKAVSEVGPIAICPSVDGKNCNGGSWNDEIIVFIDRNQDEILSKTERLLVTIPPLSANKKLVWRAFPSSRYLQFLPDGLLNVFTGTFVFCMGSGKNLIAQGLVVDKTGRMRFTKGSGKVHIGSNGTLLEC
jgi:type IV fimbrial biogenesis protein FimT